jgi:hypothetical protein
MSFFKKAFSRKGLSKWTRRVVLGLDRKQWKKLRSHVGLTSKNKLMRQIKRSLSPGSYQPANLAGAPTSAYTYQGRTLSQLMGGN